MQLAPRFRQFSEPGFMPWANEEEYSKVSVQLDPTFDWGYRPAMEPYNGQKILDPKPASCMALCREAINQLQNDFDLDDIHFLIKESGYDDITIRNTAAQLVRKMGYSSLRNGRRAVTYYKAIDFQI
jgi:hypothetical protein